jgi:hypothetical protein
VPRPVRDKTQQQRIAATTAKRNVNEEVGMIGMKRIWAFLVMCLFAGGAMGARAAGYTLSCEPARGDAINIALTGFNFKVMGSAESATGMATGRTAGKFELSVRFAMSKEYELMVQMAEDNEVLRSCKLTDGDVSGGTTAADNWNQTAVKGKNNSKVKGNAAAPASNGAFEWILTNATITSISAIGGETSSGAPESSVQAIIEAQKYSFTM